MLLRSADDCVSAARAPEAARLADGISVTLDVGLPLVEQQQLERRLNRLQTACGCVEGGLVFAATLAVGLYMVWGPPSAGEASDSRLGPTLLSVGAAALAAVATKVAAILVHRLRFRRSLQRLAIQLRGGR